MEICCLQKICRFEIEVVRRARGPEPADSFSLIRHPSAHA